MTSWHCFNWRATAALALTVVALVAGCSEDVAPAALDQSWSGVCIDLDGDGHGFQCGAGEDCDDHDSTLQVDCGCKRAAPGCGCEEGSAPEACQLPHSLDATGALICSTGTRYCRDGSWSGCEGVASYVVPALRTVSARARIDRDAAAVPCDPCHPGCYRVEDPLRPVPDAGPGVGIVDAPNGGITLAFESTDASIDAGFSSPPDGGVVDEQPCQVDEDGDCDGLPDVYDADRDGGAAHRVLFYPLGPASEVTRTLQSPIRVNTADLYLYLDATGSMTQTHERLLADLRVGNFLPNGGTGVDCLDYDGDGAPDNQLKEQGITGNLACTVRSLQFGAGFFRDIPFVGPYAANGERVGPSDYEMFEHRLDITPDVTRLDTALRGIGTRSNYNVPEGGMQGLWALATGQEIYAGWDRPGIPTRRDCPLFTTFGYPCFRQGAMPLVVQLTDAPMQNGPATAADPSTDPPTPANCLSYASEYNGAVACAPLAYDQQVLGALSAGTEVTYRALMRPAESLADAEPVGNVDDVLLTYVGDTSKMAADLTYGGLGFSCGFGPNAWNPLDQDAPDAVFRFSVGGAGTYLVSARGSRFDTSLMLLHANAAGQPDALVACADDATPFPDDLLQKDQAAELEGPLAAGDYILVLKGYTGAERGLFQVTIGRPDLKQSRGFGARSWAGTFGVRSILREYALRVITVQAGNNPFAQQQAQALAQATDTVDINGAPISGLMDADDNIGDEIVDTVLRTLAGASMDVSLRIVQAFGDPDPQLPYRVEAVDAVGDGCAPPVDRNGDGTADTHTQCRQGARPRFNLTFRSPGTFPRNPNDPTNQGGYRALAQVMGDMRFVLDEYPIYIGPGEATPPVVPPLVASATYEELVEAKGCAAGEVPRWRTQYWEATLPTGTRATFRVCAADSEAEARACTPLDTAIVSPAGPCMAQADCGTSGYCGAARICHEVTGADCSSDETCGEYGLCGQVAARQACTFTRNAADLLALAVPLAGRRFANVSIELRANDQRTQAPTIHRWSLDYTCATTD